MSNWGKNQAVRGYQGNHDHNEDVMRQRNFRNGLGFPTGRRRPLFVTILDLSLLYRVARLADDWSADSESNSEVALYIQIPFYP
jgi:hypothetical protein